MAELHARLAQQPESQRPPTHALVNNAEAVTSLLPQVLRLTADLVHAYQTEVQPWAAPAQRVHNQALDASSVVAAVDRLQAVVDAANDVSQVYDALQLQNPIKLAPAVPFVPSARLLLSTSHRQARLPTHLVPTIHDDVLFKKM